MSGDIKKLLDFELSRGNEVFNFGAGAGYVVIELRLPFHSDDPQFKEALSVTIRPYHWGSQHYDDEYDGFCSTIFPGDAIVIRRKNAAT